MKRLWAVLTAVLVPAVLLLAVPAFAAPLPVLMYHDIEERPAAENTWSVSRDQFWSDMVYLSGHGYTPLLPKDLVAVQNGEKALPEKPVMITFDDGYEHNYQYASPVLEATDMKAAIAVITSVVRSPQDPETEFLTWTELQEMYESGYWEIGSHTHNLHNNDAGGNRVRGNANGVERQAGETKAAYAQRVGGDLAESIRLIQENTGCPVLYFAYPYGIEDKWFPEVANAAGIRVSVITRSGTADTSRPLSMTRYTVSGQAPVSKILSGKSTSMESPAAGGYARIQINGEEKLARSFLIDGYRYFNLRDLAVLLADTPGRFSLHWDDGAKTTRVIPGATYTPVGSENKNTYAKYPAVSPVLACLDIAGRPTYFTAYLLQDQYYFKLRDLAGHLGFSIDWDAENNRIMLQ